MRLAKPRRRLNLHHWWINSSSSTLKPTRKEDKQKEAHRDDLMGGFEILLSGSNCLYRSFTWCTLFFSLQTVPKFVFFSLLISVTYSNKSRWVGDDSVCLMYVLLLWNGSLIAVFWCSNCEWAVWISVHLNERGLHSRARSNMSRNTFFFQIVVCPSAS